MSFPPFHWWRTVIFLIPCIAVYTVTDGIGARLSRTAIGYVVSNPVRAGLVVSPSEYPYWGSDVYSRAEIVEFLQLGPT